MKVDKYSVVTIRYTLSNSQGEVLDSSDEQELLTYMHGTEYLVSGLENAITGHEKGDKFNVEVKAEEGYGLYRENLVSKVPASMFGQNHYEIGDTFIAQTEEGQIPVVVKNIDGDMIEVDANHPLAGVDLYFAVEIVDVRDPTESEKEHGHVHLDGQCCHGHHDGDGEHCCCHGHHHDDDEEHGEGCCCHHHDDDHDHDHDHDGHCHDHHHDEHERHGH